MNFKQFHNKITHGDWTEVLKDIPDNYFDLLLTDPPYGQDYDGQICRKNPNGGHGWSHFLSSKGWDKERPTQEQFNEMLRISKQQIIWGGNYFADLLPATQEWFVWNKGQRKFSLADGELAWTSFDKALRIFDYSRAQALKDGKIHPTQKPLELFKWCLELRAKAGDLILDCYSGSGTTAVICHELGLPFVCIEKDKEYYEKSVKRLADAQAQIKLFAPKEEYKALSLELNLC